MNEEIKIITLGDIFKNLETEEKAFKFKDYITNLQEENEKAIEFMKENCDIITLNNGWIIRSKLTTTGLGKLFKILKGENND